MAGHTLRASQYIDASPETVWGVLTDLENAAQILGGVVRVEPLTHSGYGVGARWRETRSMLGRRETVDLWVAESEPPRRTVVAARSSGVDYRTEYRLSAAGDGVDLEVEFNAEQPAPSPPQRLLWAMMAPLGGRLTERMLEQDLADLAAEAERRAGKRSVV